jgi:hypothetical protein
MNWNAYFQKVYFKFFSNIYIDFTLDFNFLTREK